MSIRKSTRNIALLGIFAISSALLTSCASTTQQSAAGVNRKQLLLVSSDEVNQLSAKSYQETVTQAKSKGVLDQNKAQLARLQKIANRLIPQVIYLRPEAKTWAWEVHLQTSDELNAYCAPGGKIMFYTGIIDQLKLSDDEIATIMGHEMAHALREHGREQMSRQMVQQQGLGLLTAAVGLSAGGQQLAGMGSQLFFELPHGRGQETEADLIGLELMARAGYNPQASIGLWQKMGAANKNAQPQFLSTHPAPGNRIQNLQALIPKVLPLYQQAIGKK